ncbi:MAG TPA: metal ABC transporter substrate-binding protein, partial [Bacilli bacterium]|nr:metal ABC transporter substrate-binding protein [Bacilli bacterium]
VEELWLNPSNFLMLAQNIKNGFDEYLTNHYIKNDLNDKFEELKIEISNLDAAFTILVENSVNKDIIVNDDVFSFLSKYGFNVISLDEDTATDKTIASAKELIANGTANTIFALRNDELSDTVNKLVKETNIKVTYLHGLSNITETERSNKDNYLSIMNGNIELIKEQLYK